MDEVKKYKILIVEDDFENQKFLKIFLSRTFQTNVCDSETTFYQKIEEGDYDIILMDISLKGNKDGLELIREIRKDPKRKDIPVVVLTAHAFQKDRENAFAAGADEFLTKPIMNNELLKAIKKTFRLKTGKEI
jgi:CheY-like chemotaxis protein